MKFGLIGLGRQGKEHLDACIKLQEEGFLQLQAVCDLDASFVAKLANQLHIPGYTDVEVMIEKESIDAVILALPHKAYSDIVKKCVARDIHILQEKPMILSEVQAKLLQDKCVTHKILFQICQQRRFNKYYEYLQEKIGLIGQIVRFEYRFTLNDQRFSWYWDKEEGGGAWYGIGWHMCYIINWLFGLPSAISVHGIVSENREWEYKTEDSFYGTLTYVSGLVGQITGSVAFPSKEESLWICGKRGFIHLSRSCVRIYDNKGEQIERMEAPSSSRKQYQSQIKDFISKIDGGTVGMNPLDENSVKLVNAGTLSIQHNGAKIFIP